MKELKIAMLGYGNAGKAFEKMLEEKRTEIEKEYNVFPKIISICTGRKGNILGKGEPSIEVVETGDYDVLVELTPLVIESGMPAINHIEKALIQGKDVITGNKGPIAWDFKRLNQLANKNKCHFFYETTVMDGTPVFNLVKDTLALCKVIEVKGILNSTTNYILEERVKGIPENEIIKKGKEKGFIEADPAMDIEGYDSAAKLTALLNVLMNANIKPTDIDRQGIENITNEDLKDKKIKLVCRGFIDNGKIKGEVKPIEVEGLYGEISGTSSVVTIKTDLMGTLTIVEEDPEIEQTAYGILSDLLRVIKKRIC